MTDILSQISKEEADELAGTEARRAGHEAEAMKNNSLRYDQQGEYVWWLDVLTRDRTGAVEKTLSNLCKILDFDGELSGIAYNRMTESFEVHKPLPWRQRSGLWRESDDAQLMRYVDERYCHFPIALYAPAFAVLQDSRAFHPILDYFRNLEPWDGTPRVETLLVDYLGAPDTAYVRAVTRKILCAAVRRLFEPGCKFDNILVISGPQGVGKSTLLSRLGMSWFSDSLTLSDMNDKTAAEKLQGAWILEIGEMAGMKKADLEKVKAFLTRQDDKYRASYARRVTNHPRQCVFFGTTNEAGYLRDVTGNRRFWTVHVTGKSRWKPWDMDWQTLDQIWAEAVALAPEEALFLPKELESAAAEVQRSALEQDDREGLVRNYLDRPVPIDWEGRSLGERLSWYQTPGLAERENRTRTEPRTRTSNMEIWCECFGRNKQDLTRRDSAELTAIMSRIEGWEKKELVVKSHVYGPQRIYQRIEAAT